MTSDLREIVRAPGNKLSCPEHEDKTPSLHIFEHNGFCFSCRKRFTPAEVLGLSNVDEKKYKRSSGGKGAAPRIPAPPDFYELCRQLQRRFQNNLERDVKCRTLVAQRGFDTLRQRRAGLGCIPNRKALLSTLTSSPFDSATRELTSLERYSGAGFTHQLTFPIHDTDGMLVGWGLRRTGTSSNGPKYLKTITSRTTSAFDINLGFFNIHRCNLRGKSRQNIFLVESELDALLLTAYGIRGAVAMSTSQPKESYVQHAAKLGIKSVVYIPDCDGAGAEGIPAARKLFKDHGMTFFPVVWPVEFSGFKDVGELVVGRGIGAFTHLVSMALAAVPEAKREWSMR